MDRPSKLIGPGGNLIHSNMKPLFTLILSLSAFLALLGCSTQSTSQSKAEPANPASSNASTKEGGSEELKNLDQPPKLLNALRILYPFELKKKGITGKALISFVVNTSGKPVEAKVISATHPLFGESAKDAVLDLRFQPGVKNGRIVSCRLQQVITFDLSRQ